MDVAITVAGLALIGVLGYVIAKRLLRKKTATVPAPVTTASVSTTTATSTTTTPAGS